MRVSFGNDAVKTFIYEKESEEATPILQRQSFTEFVSFRLSASVLEPLICSNECSLQSRRTGEPSYGNIRSCSTGVSQSDFTTKPNRRNPQGYN
ncbi:hypothetical protein TELCIR_01101 [Teladorsagia circumcincta]|uniref:Uncharacterized protein n=1 Tax=Teladorsagia circumcincta TaxID=45464 RepID=A0A2G9V2T2_TELCI|nr:hypothetical protein TELCIR_01101 [Teladorsagia circumcincta]